VHPGEPTEGERILRPLREIADPIADLSGTTPYTEAQAMLDEDYPDGWRYYWKSINVPELSDATAGSRIAQRKRACGRHGVAVGSAGGASTVGP
jgi:hypothetical protein